MSVWLLQSVLSLEQFSTVLATLTLSIPIILKGFTDPFLRALTTCKHERIILRARQVIIVSMSDLLFPPHHLETEARPVGTFLHQLHRVKIKQLSFRTHNGDNQVEEPALLFSPAEGEGWW